MTACLSPCGTSPRDVPPPNPLRDAAEETASQSDHKADRAPATRAERQDAQAVGERHQGTEQQEGTGEVTVEAATAGRVGDACGASHRERSRPQDGAPDRADEVAGDERD